MTLLLPRGGRPAAVTLPGRAGSLPARSILKRPGSVTVEGGWMPGDLAVALCINNNTTVNAPGNATGITGGGSSGGSGSTLGTRLAWRYLADGDTTFGTFGLGGSSPTWSAVVACFRNPHPTAPIGTLNGMALVAGSGGTLPAIAAASARSWILAALASNSDTETIADPPEGYTYAIHGSPADSPGLHYAPRKASMPAAPFVLSAGLHARCNVELIPHDTLPMLFVLGGTRLSSGAGLAGAGIVQLPAQAT